MKKLIADIKGVTLIELIIVLTIVAIGAAIAAPNINGWMARSKLNAEARNVYSVFQLARSEAIKRNQNVAVSIRWAGTGGAGPNDFCSYVGTNADWNNGNPATFITPITHMPNGLRLIWLAVPADTGRTTWEFTSRGTFITGDQNQPFYIQSNALQSSNNKKNFTFTLGGSVAIN
jgi:prepilin-type N-terminal cleavage/methylation domain-containing protein